MKKTCFAIQTKEFEKGLDKLGNFPLTAEEEALKAQGIHVQPRSKKEDFLNKVKALVAAEKDNSLVQNAHKSAALDFGNFLTSIHRETFVMKNPNSDRFMATVMEKDGARIYVFFFAGPHEEYNKMLKQKELEKKAQSLPKLHKEEIQEKHDELKKEAEKTSVIGNIQNIREGNKNRHDKQKKYRH